MEWRTLRGLSLARRRERYRGIAHPGTTGALAIHGRRRTETS